MHQLPTLDGEAPSYLALRLDHPPGSPADVPAVLYLHGFGSRQGGEKAEFFRARALASGLAFCSFDFQGHGESGGGMRGLSLSRNLADTRLAHAELRRRGYERVVMMGSSMGGLTGIWYSALHAPEVLAGLYLAPALDLGNTFLERLGPQGVERWQRDGVLRVENEVVSCDLDWAFVEDSRQYTLERLLASYRTPSLLLQGRRDEQVDWRRVADFATRCPFPAIELHLFADGDHRLVDRKERLWQLMLEFLRGRSILPASNVESTT